MVGKGLGTQGKVRDRARGRGRDGMAGKGLDTQGKAAGFELRTQTQREAIELHFTQN